jgi:hypothetical protein
MKESILLAEITSKQYKCPDNAEEYWQTCEDFKDELAQMIGDFHPYYQRQHAMKITASAAEESCKVVREKIVAETDRAPCEQFHEMLKVRDPMISRIFNQTWFGMPESAEVRSYPGFFMLCDLCSENHLIAPEEPE